MTNADILARFPGPVRLKAPRAGLLTTFIFCCVFVAASTVTGKQHFMWFMLIFFGGAALVMLPALLRGANVITLHGDRLEIRYIFARRSIAWNRMRDVLAVGLGADDKVAFTDNTQGGGLPGLNGRNVALPFTYGQSAGELAALLVQWRDCALAASATAAPKPSSSPAARSMAEAPVATELSKAGADLLARFPGPLALRPPESQWMWLLVLVPLVAAVWFCWARWGSDGLWLLLRVGGFSVAGVLALKLSGRDRRLTLSSDGFEIASGRMRSRYAWNAAQDFIAVRFEATTRVAFNKAGEPALWTLERADRPQLPANTGAATVFRGSALPDNYSLPDAELAALMTHWRERALSARQSEPADAGTAPVARAS